MDVIKKTGYCRFFQPCHADFLKAIEFNYQFYKISHEDYELQKVKLLMRLEINAIFRIIKSVTRILSWVRSEIGIYASPHFTGVLRPRSHIDIT